MSDQLTIYIDRLIGGNSEDISAVVSPDLMGIWEAELEFNDPIEVSGSVYATEDHLVMNLNLKTALSMPCSICNQIFQVPIEIENHYTTEPLEAITSGLFQLNDVIREAILLEVPAFFECNLGNCPERALFEKFLKKQKVEPVSKEEAKSYLPFADLE